MLGRMPRGRQGCGDELGSAFRAAASADGFDAGGSPAGAAKHGGDAPVDGAVALWVWSAGWIRGGLYSGGLDEDCTEGILLCADLRLEYNLLPLPQQTNPGFGRI